MAKSTASYTLAQYQQLMRDLARERNFNEESVSEVFGLLVEEVGELAKAIRKVNGQKIGAHSKVHSVEDEAADVFWLLIDLCNRLDIDLAAAFDAKEVKNRSRAKDYS